MVVLVIKQGNSWNELSIVLGTYGNHLLNNSCHYNNQRSMSVVGDLLQGDEFYPKEGAERIY